MGKTVDEVLAENLNRLMSAPTSTLRTNVALGRRSGMGQATVDRARRHQPGLSIAKVEALARAFNLEAWQLLAPNLGTEVGTASAAPLLWPFKEISPRDLTLLSANDLALVEERIRTLLELSQHSHAQKSE